MTQTEIIETTLRKLPVFAQLPQQFFHQLASHLQSQELGAGDTLFHRGDQSTDMFIIMAGRVKVVLPDEYGRELVLDEYGQGKSIGELALLSQQSRTVTIIANEPTTLLKLSRDTFLHLLKTTTQIELNSLEDWQRHVRRQNKIQLLQRMDWFAALPEDDLVIIANKTDTKHFERNEILIHRGDSGDAFYIIVQGWVSAFVTPDEGSRIVLNQLGPGEIFGEMALLEDKPRSASIMALTPLEVLTLDRDDFMAILEKHTPIALETLRTLSNKLRFAYIYLENAIAWSQRIADADYSMVLDQIKMSQDDVIGAMESDESRINSFLAAFITLVRGVQQREDALRQEIKTLQMKIEIDQEKREEQVQAITDNPFFDSLKAQAKKIRQERDDGEQA
ncbi:MAG: cyclic nucleotide-binding domain-containing protein [Chloroflexota bacterium]